MRQRTKRITSRILMAVGLTAFGAQIAYLIYRGVKNSDHSMLVTGLSNTLVFLSLLFGVILHSHR